MKGIFIKTKKSALKQALTVLMKMHFEFTVFKLQNVIHSLEKRGGGAYIPRGLCLDLVFRFMGRQAFNWNGS